MNGICLLVNMSSTTRNLLLKTLDHLPPLILLFEKPSLRTRVTFEVAMQALGGNSLFMDLRGEQIGQREPIAEILPLQGRGGSRNGFATERDVQRQQRAGGED